jgi:hypothetical protein
MDQLIGGGKAGVPAADLVKDTNTASFRADVLDAAESKARATAAQ